MDPGRLTSTDRVVPAGQLRQWLHTPLWVEEELDGANVSLWVDRGQVCAAGRGGADSMDRAGQLGRLRAWVGHRAEPLTTLLSDGWVAYGEWLWMRHGTSYERLRDFLVVLDLWHPTSGMAPVEERNMRLAESGLLAPPHRWSGMAVGLTQLQALLGPSAYGDVRAEGVVVRRLADGERCKIVDPDYRRPTTPSSPRERSTRWFRTPEHVN